MQKIRNSLLLAFVFATVAAASTDGEPRLSDPGWRELGQGVDELVGKATVAWRTSQRWPRGQLLDLPDTYDQAIARELVGQALSLKWHKLAAVDGYVKLQLLNFEPDLEVMSPPAIGALVRAMPAFVPQPDVDLGARQSDPLRRKSEGDLAYFVSGTQRVFISDLEPTPEGFGFNPTLSVLNEGVVLAVRDAVVTAYRDVRTEVRRRNRQLEEARELTARANAPTIAYRDALLNQLPRRRGMRFVALIEDLEDRIRAGDPSVPEATERIVAEGEHVRDQPRRLRRQLASRVKEIYKLRTKVVDELRHMRGKRIGARYRTVKLSKQARSRLLAHLRG